MEVAYLSVFGLDSIGMLARPADVLSRLGIYIEDEIGWSVADDAVFVGTFKLVAEPASLNALAFVMEDELADLLPRLLRHVAPADKFDGPTSKFQLRAIAPDKIGLTAAVLFILMQHGINVAKFRGSARRAAGTGLKMFIINAQLEIAGQFVDKALEDFFASLWKINGVADVQLGWSDDEHGEEPPLPKAA